MNHPTEHDAAAAPGAPERETNADPLNRWVGLAGPTASGKSGISLLVAHHEPVEIISVDSALVYKGMDIGTAKPTLRQRAQVVHHLIDILDPLNAYSAARFAQEARRLIRDINQRGRLPLLVGGTMLYFKALMDGLDAMPASQPDVREQLNQEGRLRGWPALHAELMAVDPLTAQRLKPLDSQRIQRALEVWRTSGKPLSSFQTRLQGRASASGLSPRLFISLEPSNRAWLHARIAERFEYMLQGDFLGEVRLLMARGDLSPDLPSMRCVGYRQAWDALAQGLQGADLRAAVSERGIAATRQLAKRQLTWLRSVPQRWVIDAQSATAADEVLSAVRKHAAH